VTLNLLQEMVLTASRGNPKKPAGSSPNKVTVREKIELIRERLARMAASASAP
jgi:hypothetical protein